MFSRLVLRAARVTPTSAVGRPLALARPSITPVFQALSARSYAAGGPDVSASYKNVEARILDIFRTFDKVNQDNVSPPVAHGARRDPFPSETGPTPAASRSRSPFLFVVRFFRADTLLHSSA